MLPFPTATTVSTSGRAAPLTIMATSVHGSDTLPVERTQIRARSGEKGSLDAMKISTLARAYSLCEDKPTERRAQKDVSTQSVQLQSANISSSSSIRLGQCSSGHSIQLFVSCEPRSECAPVSESTATSSRCPSTLFACEMSRDHVSYTLVCNNRRDCLDGSDETFCVYKWMRRSLTISATLVRYSSVFTKLTNC